MKLFYNSLREYSDLAYKMKVLENQVGQCSIALLQSLASGGTIYIAGNAGAGSNAEHFVSELVGRFYKDRHAIPAVSLNSDTTTITCIANDFGFENIFQRQLQALFNPDKDIFIGMSTSGNSNNINKAVEYLNKIGGKSILLLGKDGGEAVKLQGKNCETIIIPSYTTPRIQEAHMFILHCWAENIEKKLYFRKVDYK